MASQLESSPNLCAIWTCTSYQVISPMNSLGVRIILRLDLKQCVCDSCMSFLCIIISDWHVVYTCYSYVCYVHVCSCHHCAYWWILESLYMYNYCHWLFYYLLQLCYSKNAYIYRHADVVDKLETFVTCDKVVSALLQACHKPERNRLLQGCYKVVTCLWQGGLGLVTVSIPWLMQPCYNQCTRWPQTCYHLVTSQHERVVTRLLQTCYKLVTGLTFLYGMCT